MQCEDMRSRLSGDSREALRWERQDMAGAPRRDRNETKAFAGQLRKRRRRKGWTQQEFAARVGVKTATVAAWEAGRCFPCVRTRQRICDALGATLEDLRLPPYDGAPSKPAP